MSKVDTKDENYIGQHCGHDFYNPGPTSGMKTSIHPAARIGQAAGPEQTHPVPKPAPGSLINTTGHADWGAARHETRRK